MTNWPEPGLLSDEEMKLFVVCEYCGIVADKNPWPRGWIGSGMSRVMIPTGPYRKRSMAWWCPEHHDFIMHRPNVTPTEIATIRMFLTKQITIARLAEVAHAVL